MTLFAFGAKCGGLARERVGGRAAALGREQPLVEQARQRQRADAEAGLRGRSGAA